MNEESAKAPYAYAQIFIKTDVFVENETEAVHEDFEEDFIRNNLLTIYIYYGILSLDNPHRT